MWLALLLNRNVENKYSKRILKKRIKQVIQFFINLVSEMKPEYCHICGEELEGGEKQMHTCTMCERLGHVAAEDTLRCKICQEHEFGYEDIEVKEQRTKGKK